jgi:phosphotransferase system  glucose/maltose/N-acetylglucosamine-specific IIC component
MGAVYYTLAAIILYLAADWILRRLEQRAGRVFEHRTLVFFVLLLSMALVTFAFLRSWLKPD